MNLSTLFFSFVIVALMAAGLVFAGGAMTVKTANTVVDTWGTPPTNITNTSVLMVSNITNVGQVSSTGLLLILGCVIVAGGVALLFAYAKTR